jgi:hypothetical protein
MALGQTASGTIPAVTWAYYLGVFGLTGAAFVQEVGSPGY